MNSNCNDHQAYTKKLKELSTKIFINEEIQKKRIASDLHDHVGQSLAMLKFKLAKMKGDAIFCGMDSEIDEMRVLIDQIIRYTRNLTVELCPPVLYELGLAPALKWLAEQAKEKRGLTVYFTDQTDNLYLADQIKVALFRSIQELLNNVERHSKSKEAWVTLAFEESSFKIVVEDKGEGFSKDSPSSSGYGLFSIKERIETFGGSLTLNTIPENGTTVTIRISRYES